MRGGTFTHSLRHEMRAFSLLELLIVIAIIALLIAMLFPSLRIARLQAERLQCAGNLRDFGNACTVFKTEKNHYPKVLGDEYGEKLRVGGLANVGLVAETLVGSKLLASPTSMFCPISLKRDRYAGKPYRLINIGRGIEEFWRLGEISYTYLVGVRHPFPLPDGTPTFNAAAESPDFEANDAAVLAGDRAIDLDPKYTVPHSNHGREGGWFYFVGGDIQWRDWATLTAHPAGPVYTWYWPRTLPSPPSPQAALP